MCTMRMSAAFIVLAALCVPFTQTARADNVVLITADEAKLPAQKGAVAMTARGVTRGPKVELLSQATALRSPIRLQLKFQTFGGAKVDVGSVQATYLRTPTVDLTPRIRPYVSSTGVDLPAAQLPPGDHIVRIDLKDSDGRAATTSFVLKVEP